MAKQDQDINPMNQKNRFISITVCFFLLFIYSSIYSIAEGQHALLLRLGNLVTSGSTHLPKVYGPGLHIRMPMIDDVLLFDTRLQTLDVGSSDASNPPRIVTLEKKNVIVDYYVKWRIRNLTLFYTRTGGSYSKAQQLLAQQLNDSLRAEFGRRTITEVVSDDRTNIMDRLRAQADATARSLGIEVIDVRIKRIDLPEEVSSAIFEQMRAEREKVASEHRSQGKALAEAIRAKADANATITVARAQAEASHIRGKGDAAAATIYTQAYSKNTSFFIFLRSLQAYKNSFTSKDDVIVLQPSNTAFFRYFKNSGATSEQH